MGRVRGSLLESPGSLRALIEESVTIECTATNSTRVTGTGVQTPERTGARQSMGRTLGLTRGWGLGLTQVRVNPRLSLTLPRPLPGLTRACRRLSVQGGVRASGEPRSSRDAVGGHMGDIGRAHE